MGKKYCEFFVNRFVKKYNKLLQFPSDCAIIYTRVFYDFWHRIEYNIDKRKWGTRNGF